MFLGKEEFVWWIGIVEDNYDPALLGRVRARIFGYHPPLWKDEIKTENLPWAACLGAANVQGAYGRPNVGDWVVGFFMDSHDAQEPIIMGVLPGNIKSDLGKEGSKWSKESEMSFPSIYAEEEDPVDTNRNSYTQEIDKKVRLSIDPSYGKTFKPKLEFKDLSGSSGLEIYSDDIHPTAPSNVYRYVKLSNGNDYIELKNNTSTGKGEIVIKAGAGIRFESDAGSVTLQQIINALN